MVVKLDENKALKNAFLAYVPMIKEDYLKKVGDELRRMLQELGPELEGVYNAKNAWYRTFGAMRHVMKHEQDGLKINSYGGRETRYVYSIDEKKLEKAADEYAEAAALGWYNKMVGKLVTLDDVKVSDPRSFFVNITGRHGDDKVEVKQQIILNVSRLGTVFNQFPAHIYVNGKFQSEAQYKKTVQGWGIVIPEKIPTQYKCGKCGYTGRMGDFKNHRFAYGLYCPKCKSGDVSKVAGTGPASQKKQQFYTASDTKLPHYFIYKGAGDKYTPGYSDIIVVYTDYKEAQKHGKRLFRLELGRDATMEEKDDNYTIPEGAFVSAHPFVPQEDRPKQFHFVYKTQNVSNHSWMNPSQFGAIEEHRDWSKGMTIEEAWEKLKKDKMRYGSDTIERIFDPEVTVIRTWNDQLIWREDSGDPLPQGEIVEEYAVWQEKNKEHVAQKA